MSIQDDYQNDRSWFGSDFEEYRQMRRRFRILVAVVVFAVVATIWFTFQ